jgi:glutamine amidotransferase PdxT
VPLFQLLDGLQGTVEERCTCIRTVLREAERFKRAALVHNLADFEQNVALTAQSAFRPIASTFVRSPFVETVSP